MLDTEFEPLRLPILRLLQRPETSANTSKGFDFLIFNEFRMTFARFSDCQPLSSFESYGFLLISHCLNVRNGDSEMTEMVEGLK
jgi:hypothetical protein